MNDINKHCDDNLGGLYRFNFIPVSEVQSIAEPIGCKVLEPLETTTIGRWYECYASEGTIKFIEDLQQSEHGDFHKVKLSAFIPKDRTDITDQLEKMRNKNFIIDYIDNNGHRKLIGKLDEPLRFTYSLDTGSSVPNKNGHTIEFYGDIIKKSPTYFI